MTDSKPSLSLRFSPNNTKNISTLIEWLILTILTLLIDCQLVMVLREVNL